MVYRTTAQLSQVPPAPGPRLCYCARRGAGPPQRSGTLLPQTSTNQPLEVQALEVIPVDRDLVRRAFPVGNVERPKSSAKAGFQLVGHGRVGRGAGRNVDLRTLDE